MISIFNHLSVSVHFLQREQQHSNFRGFSYLALAFGINMQPLSAYANGDQTKIPAQTTPPLQFDTYMLEQRGIDSRVADFLSRKSRFVEGIRPITLVVNGVSRGTVEATFDEKGELCFTRALLDQGHLKLPRQSQTTEAQVPCYDFLQEFPQTEVELRPGREEVVLVVTPQTLRPANEDVAVYERGGTAGLMNYNLSGYQHESSGQSRRYTSANTEFGLNADDWIIRSRHVYTQQDGTSNFQMLNSYAQTTLIEQKSILQLGQISISNSAFPGTAISGFQLLPENALSVQARGGTIVEGIAQSQARIEVRQSGALIHTTLVPAGPFTLPDIKLLDFNSDLEVTVIESNGEQRQFTVAAASLAQFSDTAPGYSIALGQVRTFGVSNREAPIVATSSGGWLLGPQNTLSAGVLVSQNHYQSLAFTFDTSFFNRSSLMWRSRLSHAGEENTSGLHSALGFGLLLTDKLGASIHYTRQMETFRDLMDSTHHRSSIETYDRTRDQYGFSLSWSDPLVGGFSTSYSTSKSFDGRQTHYLNGSWGKSFDYFSITANIDRSLSRDTSRQIHPDALQLKSKALYVNISIPFGKNHNLSSYASQRDGHTRFGTAFSGNTDIASYQLGADSNTQNRQRDYYASINMIPRYTSLNLGYSQNGEDSRSFNGQLNGGMALHGGRLMFSPYPLHDTFAVAQVGDMSGVKLSTPSGPVWTDRRGYAVVPQLNAFQSSQVEIATKTLPRNVDIKNGIKSVTAGRGAVKKLDFPVITTRRVLLRSQDLAGNHLPKGGGVFTHQEEFVTTVLDHGKIFLSDEQLSHRLIVRQRDGQYCRLDFTLPDKADPDVYFESANAVCTTL